MKKCTLLIICLGFATITLAQTVSYEDHFSEERLRIDLVFTGNATSQDVFLLSLHKEPEWAGPKKQLIPPFTYGEYQYKIYTKQGVLIFSKGFNSLFMEWRTTREATFRDMAYNTSLWIPYPKDTVYCELYERKSEDGTYQSMKKFLIDPADCLISEEKPVCQAERILDNGPVENKVDLLFVAEGYRTAEMEKFKRDAARFVEYLFEYEPFRSRRDDFNIWILPLVSEDSGPDIPRFDVWNKTALGSSFDTFYTDRYLTAPDQRLLAQAVSGAPFDAIYVIVNANKYGGGGIYNYYGLSTSDHTLSKQVFVHEFGHSFAGLADEYYNSEVAYINMYPEGVEPWEPNITTLVDFESKWKDMMDTEGVGLHEGAAYVAKGIFRPAPDCRMHTNEAPAFCPVCQRAISRMIDFYTK
ncbi:MAG TPA: M64 family metallopeptidase [Bacteroidales bacterium]|nr:M64 family metallopeptidase [Bacteroidales bacterium]